MKLILLAGDFSFAVPTPRGVKPEVWLTTGSRAAPDRLKAYRHLGPLSAAKTSVALRRYQIMERNMRSNHSCHSKCGFRKNAALYHVTREPKSIGLITLDHLYIQHTYT